jgi:flagellar biosynthesis protein FlhB
VLLSVVAAGFSCFLCLHPLFSFQLRWRLCGHDANTIFCALTAFSITTTWIVTNHWLFLNTLGGCMCIVMLSVVKVPTVRVALLLYAGLLAYDVFWVFFSHHFFARNVMMVRHGVPMHA